MWIWSNTAKQYDERLFSVYSLQCVQQPLLDLFTLQPHTRWPQFATWRQTIPAKASPSRVVVTVHAAQEAVLEPESAAVEYCTVWSGPLVAVSVKCAEHPAIVVADEWITTGVTRVPRHLQRVVGGLWLDYERYGCKCEYEVIQLSSTMSGSVQSTVYSVSSKHYWTYLHCSHIRDDCIFGPPDRLPQYK